MSALCCSWAEACCWPDPLPEEPLVSNEGVSDVGCIDIDTPEIPQNKIQWKLNVFQLCFKMCLLAFSLNLLHMCGQGIAEEVTINASITSTRCQKFLRCIKCGESGTTQCYHITFKQMGQIVQSEIGIEGEDLDMHETGNPLNSIIRETVGTDEVPDAVAPSTSFSLIRSDSGASVHSNMGIPEHDDTEECLTYNSATEAEGAER